MFTFSRRCALDVVVVHGVTSILRKVDIERRHLDLGKVGVRLHGFGRREGGDHLGLARLLVYIAICVFMKQRGLTAPSF